MLLICLSPSFAVAGFSTVAAVIRPGWLPRLGRRVEGVDHETTSPTGVEGSSRPGGGYYERLR